MRRSGIAIGLLAAVLLTACGPGVAATAPASVTLTTPVPTVTPTPSPAVTMLPTAAAGLTVEVVLAHFAPYDLTCEGIDGDWGCFAHPGGNTYYGLVTKGPKASELTKVRVTYTVPTSVADESRALAFFQDMARLPYAGAEPEAATAWVAAQWDGAKNQPPVEAVFGSGRYVLTLIADDAGANYALDLLPATGESLE